jgi:hypothetical protein
MGVKSFFIYRHHGSELTFYVILGSDWSKTKKKMLKEMFLKPRPEESPVQRTIQFDLASKKTYREVGNGFFVGRSLFAKK